MLFGRSATSSRQQGQPLPSHARRYAPGVQPWYLRKVRHTWLSSVKPALAAIAAMGSSLERSWPDTQARRARSPNLEKLTPTERLKTEQKKPRDIPHASAASRSDTRLGNCEFTRSSAGRSRCISAPLVVL